MRRSRRLALDWFWCFSVLLGWALAASAYVPEARLHLPTSTLREGQSVTATITVPRASKRPETLAIDANFFDVYVGSPGTELEFAL